MDHLELVADCSNDPRARACVCVYGGFEGGGCLVLEAKIPRSVFDGAECCRVTWNIGFGGERTVPRSENSFSVEASQRFAIIVHFYLLKKDSIGWIGLSINRKDATRFSGNEKLEYEIKRNGGLLKGNIRDIRVGRGYNILHLRGCISSNYDTSNRQRR